MQHPYILPFSMWTLLYFVFTVHGVTPDMTREGGSIPVTLTLQNATGKNVMLLPMGSSDDGAHSQNEKFNISNYIQGVRGKRKISQVLQCCLKMAFSWLERKCLIWKDFKKLESENELWFLILNVNFRSESKQVYFRDW